jgi:glucose-1-phosphate cytidylyltransferase
VNINKSERVLKSLKYFNNTNYFCVCYGDILADVNFKKSLDLLEKNKFDATLFGYYENSSFGHIKFIKSKVLSFEEKPKMKDPINIGFYMFKSNLIKLFKNKTNELETDIIPNLIKKKKLGVILHQNFQYTINTKKDFNNFINKLKKDNKFNKIINE